MTKTKPRVRVARQLTDARPRTQAPHTHISERLSAEWANHFDGHGADSAGVELGMQLIMYLTNSPHISAGTLVKRLCNTYPDLAETLESNAFALAQAFSGITTPTE